MKSILIAIMMTLSCSLYAVENIIDCNEGRYHISINENDDGSYTYISFDQKGDTSKASLILNNGTLEHGHRSESYTFKNNFYKYQIYEMFDGAGGEIGLLVFHFGKEIYKEVCRKSSFE